MKRIKICASILAFLMVLFISSNTLGLAVADTITNVTPNSALKTAYYYLPGSPKTSDMNWTFDTAGGTESYWIDTAPNIGDYDYSFSVMGDIQTINYFYPDYFSGLFDYIVDNAEERNTRFCFSMGDITDRDSREEWDRAKKEYDRIGKLMGYSLVRGNHDGREMMEDTFGGDTPYASQMEGFYMDDVTVGYTTFSVGIHKYLVITLDWFIDEMHLQWASDLMESHPDYNVIVTVHAFLGKTNPKLSSDGTRYEIAPTKGEYPLPSSYKDNLDVNNTPHSDHPSLDGLDVWNALKKHANLKLIMGGHVSIDDVLYWEGTGDNGNKVVGLLINPQDVDVSSAYMSGYWRFDESHPAYNGGTYYAGKPAGIITTLYVSNDGHIFLEHYSTVRKKWFKSTNQFSFDLDLISINDSGSVYTQTVG